MLLFFIFLLPILVSGIIILRKITNLTRIELILPTGSILGLTIFTFLLNTTAFIIKGYSGILIAYLLTICTGLAIKKLANNEEGKIEFLRGKDLVVWLMGVLGWSWLIIWKAAHASIGSDTNLYYSIAHSFIRGNFPPLTPWQPDLPLTYHLGVFQLLGAFYYFTNLSFEFLHIIFSVIFILCSSQIIVWIWKKEYNIASFLWGNLAAATVLISFGFLKFIIPISFTLPKVSNLHQLFLWIRDLPTVNQTIEAYGAPVNLDTLIYFLFHSFGLAIILSLIVLAIYVKARNILYKWTVFVIALTTLALVNESAFVISVFALTAAGILEETISNSFRGRRKQLSSVMLIFGLLLIMSFFVVVQGGMITNLILGQKNLEKSVLIFPNNAEKKEDLVSYHRNQSISKWLPIEEKWLPLAWFHIGTDVLVLLCVISFIVIRFSKEQKIILITLFAIGISSLLAYYYIVPRYLAANGNRFLAFAFVFLSLFMTYALQNLTGVLSKGPYRYFFLGLVILFMVIPTVLPPLALLTKTRFGENRLTPRKEQVTPAVEWIKNHLPYNSRIVVLDVRAPHPSGMARVMVQAGVFAPVFPGDVRVYTIEASPEYFDVAYFLSPNALQKLKIDTLLIDSAFFSMLPEIRKKQLGSIRYFENIYDNSKQIVDWEKIYKVKDDYFIGGGELLGTFEGLSKFFPQKGRVYIDSEENFSPSYLRRAIIFSLRDRELYFLPQSGVYLNVETDINQSSPRADANYDYLVLGRNTPPENICKCQANLKWVGLKGEVNVWESRLVN